MRRGFITLECMIALGLCAVTTVSAYVIIHQAQTHATRTHQLQEALDLAKKTTLDFSRTESTTHERSHTIEIEISRIDPFTKEITTRVTPDGLSTVVELSSIATDPRAEGSSQCDLLMNFGWNNPRVVGAVSLSPNQSFTDIQIKGLYAYATASASGSSDPNFYVIDVSDELAPSIVASLRTGSARTNNNLHVTPRYAFIAASSSTQLQVVDISDITHPRVVAIYKMPGVTVSGRSGIGSAVYFYHDMLFVGLTKAAGPEFFVVDVSNPVRPRSVGSLEINATVNNIFAIDSKIYITATNNEHLQLIDISNPSFPQKISVFSSPDSHHTGMSIAYSNDVLFMGRNVDAIGMKQSPKTELFSFFDRTAIQSPLTSLHVGASVNAVIARLPLLALATNVSGKELQFWNISDTHAATRISTLQLGGGAVGLECSSQTFIAISNNNQGRGVLSIIQGSP
ncbi:hypothetical protein HY620_00020 [Candidatus Uhrbacteria bacterium]|nr:hypothetical protein [Candidatus Uhrbacteria bacterium]